VHIAQKPPHFPIWRFLMSDAKFVDVRQIANNKIAGQNRTPADQTRKRGAKETGKCQSSGQLQWLVFS